MKKLLTALVLTLSTAALAQSDADSKAQQENQQNDTSRMKTGIDSTEVLPELSGSKAHKEDAQASANLMNKTHAYNVRGTVTKATSEDIILSRQGEKLPDVKLDVRAQTMVMLDGKKVTLSEIPEGSQVRASFQLEGDDAVAVDVNATSPHGVSGGAKKSTKKETKDTKGTTAPAPAPAPAPEAQPGTQPGTTGTQPAPKP